jgi:hypothetical protein
VPPKHSGPSIRPDRQGVIFFGEGQGVLSSLPCEQQAAGDAGDLMAEKLVLVGVIPEAVVIGPDDQVSWVAGESLLKVEFDPNRCPFSSNVFQAPAGMRLLSGPPRPGTKPGSFKYRLWLNDQLVGSGEIILREK